MFNNSVRKVTMNYEKLIIKRYFENYWVMAFRNKK